MDSTRIDLFGFRFDPISLAEATARVLAWARAPERNCRMVVTPNVDHVVLLEDNPDLKPLYDSADLVLADGMPVVWASKLLGKPLPERVAGSDIFPRLLAEAEHGPPISVFLLGGAEGVADRARDRIVEKYPWIRVAGTYCPPMGFDKRAEEYERATAAVGDAQPDVVLVGLGAPKQERFVQNGRTRLQCKVALCIGATIDFMAGAKPRAPQWMRASGLEWLHRLSSEPKRLTRRYAHDASVFPRLVMREAVRRVTSA